MTKPISQARPLPAAGLQRGDVAADSYLDTPPAADYLQLSDAYLRKMRKNGEGPSYFRFGRRVVYRKSDLDSWAALRRVGIEK